MKKYGIILAGGDGTRLWPLSRKDRPKQFLNLYGESSMVVETVKCVENVIQRENIFVVTRKNQEELMRKHIKTLIPSGNIIVEPEAKSTAASVGYAATKIEQQYGDGLMCIFSCDSYIENTDAFTKTVNRAITVGEKENKIVCIGVKPLYPSINFGYIKINKNSNRYVFDIEKFIEKPNHKKAEEYYKDGNYLWNTGITVSKISVILNSFKKLMPEYYLKLQEIKDNIDEQKMLSNFYSNIENISISRAIFEKERNIKVVIGYFKWMDVGSLDALSTIYKKDRNGNSNKGNVINMDSRNCISLSDKKTIVTLGVDNLIIVETDDTVLVCNKESAKDIKKLVKKMQEKIS